MEQFLTRLGQDLGFRMADSKLMWAHGQLRFCSRYFLKPGESLVHGAEIFWGYLDDQQFVEDIEAADESRNVFSFQVVQDAILHAYPDEAEDIVGEFVRMLLYDAIVGNNDRHFYNWGVISHPEAKIRPYFSPIYDTARAFYWNASESKLKVLYADKNQYRVKLKKYAELSRPKIGWDGAMNLNHFDLISKVRGCSDQCRSIVDGFERSMVLQAAEQLLFDGEFTELMSELRRRIIIDCLEERLNSMRF